MEKWYWKKTFNVLIIIMFSLLSTLPVLAQKSNDKIKVGYFLMSGYQEIDQNGAYTGYGYEYLMDIAKYTGWDYEFIVAPYNECLQMLEDGRIDVMGSLIKSDEREEIFDYATIPSGISSSTLITTSSEKYAYEDFDAFDGMRVGVLDGSVINRNLLNYCKENNFDVDIIKFQSQNKMTEALMNGEVDTLLIRDIADINNNQIIAKFDTSPYYFAVTKGNAKVLDELNEALEYIHTTERFYESKLFKNYYSEDENVALTREELDYINEKEYITVALNGDLPGVSYYNPTTKEFSGIAVSFLDLISEKIGLPFSYEVFSNEEDVSTYLKNYDINLVGPIYDSSVVTLADSVQLLKTVFPTKMVKITRSGEYYGEDDCFTIALPKAIYDIDAIKGYFPNAAIIECRDIEEALDKVNEKEADITFDTEIMANYRLQSPFYRKLSITSTYWFEQDMTFAAEKGKDKLLVSILNKAILSITESERNQVILSNSVSIQYKKSLMEFIYEHRITLRIALSFLLIFLGLAINLLFFKRSIKKIAAEKIVLEKKRKEDLIYQEELIEKASHDTLTGLYNRAGEEIIDDLLEEIGEGTLFMVDMDELKNTNDTYGHEAGDAILAQIGQTLDSLFSPSDVVARIGGDEFIAFIPGLSQPEMVSQKANRVIEALKKPYYLNGEEIAVSCSIGIAISPEHGFTYKELREVADQTMYDVKYKSKGHYAVYSDDENEDVLKFTKFEKQLHRSVHKLENILNKIPGGIALYKLTDHFEPLYFTDGVFQIHGMEREEYANWFGNDIKKSINQSDVKLLQNFFDNMKTNGKADEVLRLKHKDGRYVWGFLSGCIVGTYEDSKLCQVIIQEMSKYTNLFVKILEDDKDAICVSDTRNHRVLYMNEKAHQLMGIKEELKDKKCFEVMWNNRQECENCLLKIDHTSNILRHVIHNGKNYLIESKIIDWDGVDIHVEYIKEEIDP
ncbi:MAG: diguanylate cyclase domain-containing protein [Lachnospiraceae bacterium]